jgi:hypothetical protein
VSFPAGRYESLWTKSPFAVATSEETVQASPDYMMVGIANVDGVLYASVIEKDNQQHYLISSDKQNQGFTLTSITKSPDGQDTYANVVKDGQPLTLKLEQAPESGPTVAANGAPVLSPGIIAPQIVMPGAEPSPRFPHRRNVINLPPRYQRFPNAMQQPNPAPQFNTIQPPPQQPFNATVPPPPR